VGKAAFSDGAAATIGTPVDPVNRIKSVFEISGGFVHDWANSDGIGIRR
jgi:hypothetical protein